MEENGHERDEIILEGKEKRVKRDKQLSEIADDTENIIQTSSANRRKYAFSDFSKTTTCNNEMLTIMRV